MDITSSRLRLVLARRIGRHIVSERVFTNICGCSSEILAEFLRRNSIKLALVDVLIAFAFFKTPSRNTIATLFRKTPSKVGSIWRRVALSCAERSTEVR